MKIKFLGHACFLIETQNKKILTDPYEPQSYGGAVAYTPIEELVDIVTVSHSHSDHCGTNSLEGNPIIKNTEKEEVFEGIKIKGLKSFHDEKGGFLRGQNIIFVIESEGLKIAHLGDLGTLPSQDILDELKNIDVILIPVGGMFTIDYKKATELINLINPKIVIPMHYKTEKLGFDIDRVDKFLEGKENVTRKESSEIEIEKENLPSETQIIVLKPANV